MPEAAQLQPKPSQRLTSQDASFLYNESFNGPMHIGSLGIFDGPLPLAAVTEHIRKRLHLVPRYRQRLNFVPFNLNHATWEDDPNFKLENHIIEHVLPPGSGDAELIRATMDINETVMDRQRPMWEMHIINGLADGRAGLVTKIHHCVIDGVSGIELSTVVMDFQPEPPEVDPPKEEWSPRPLPSPGESVSTAMFDLAQQQLDAARRAQSLFSQPDAVTDRNTLMGQATQTMLQMASRPIISAPWNRPPVTYRRGFAWSKFEFGEFRGIRGVLGGTVNDVVLAVLSEGAARYLAEKGYNTAGQMLRLGCPVSVRREDQGGALGNRVSMMFPMMPAAPMDMVERLGVVREATERIKLQREAQGLELMTEQTDSVAPSLVAMNAAVTTAMTDAFTAFASLVPQLPSPPPVQLPGSGINFVATNVPGVQVPQYLVGRKMTDTIGILALGGNLGYGVAIGSYDKSLYFGMICEPRLMPDVDRMKEHVEAAYADLRAAALALSAQSANPPSAKAKAQKEGR